MNVTTWNALLSATLTWIYFVMEEEYLAHWNSFHAAISPWYICPTQGCGYVFVGEPDAFD